jgi:hypothetical protein
MKGNMWGILVLEELRITKKQKIYVVSYDPSLGSLSAWDSLLSIQMYLGEKYN